MTTLAQLNPKTQTFRNLVSAEIDNKGYLNFSVVGDILQALSTAAQYHPSEISKHQFLLHQSNEKLESEKRKTG